MSIELKMPAMSPTMEKGTLAKWLVAEGDTVKAGDLVAEVETDKATMEIEAIVEGRVAELIVPEGTDGVAVGAVIALIAVQGDAAPTPAEPKVAALVTAQSPGTVAAPSLPAVPVAEATKRHLLRARGIEISPLAARIAEARGIDISGISGTGPRGRILRADLGIASVAPMAIPVAGSAQAAATVAAVGPAVPPDVAFETVKLSSMRKTIARRLGESKQTVPHFYLTAHCRIDALLKLRGELNQNLSARGVKLSVNDLVIKAMAIAMVREPDANVQFAGDEMYRFSRADIAMAVAIDGGLITPVIRDVTSLSLSAVAEQSKQLAAKARSGTLLPEDYQGGTASISNLGMYGVDEMIPVINPPQALILGIGSGIEKPWKVDGAIALATVMTVTASFDHRAIDGAAAARFMAAFRDLIEEPIQLVC
jgi:pyruvate dehydrogenase E2 component (dihydrolipoamide acetyltransferase)